MKFPVVNLRLGYLLFFLLTICGANPLSADEIESPEADGLLREALANLRAGELESAVTLDLLIAANSRGDT